MYVRLAAFLEFCSSQTGTSTKQIYIHYKMVWQLVVLEKKKKKNYITMSNLAIDDQRRVLTDRYSDSKIRQFLH